MLGRGKHGRPPPRPLTSRAQAGRFSGVLCLRHPLQGRCARSSQGVFVTIGRKCLVSASGPDPAYSATMAVTIIAVLRAPTCRAVARRSVGGRRPLEGGGGPGLEGGGIPTAADRTPGLRRERGSAIRAAWLTMAACGRLPGGGTRCVVSELVKTPRSEFRGIFRGVGGHANHTGRGGDFVPVCRCVGRSRAAKPTRRNGIAAGASFRA